MSTFNLMLSKMVTTIHIFLFEHEIWLIQIDIKIV